MIGRFIGNYRVTRKIGEGGMGAVYEARHRTIRQRVAIKVLHAHYASERETRDRFCIEARAMSALSHPGVVNVFDYGQTDDGVAYIIMEYLEGESLHQRLRRVVGKLPVYSALHIGRQIATALVAAHCQGIVHRDLKPGNIFIVTEPEATCGERIKLLDFGLAKLMEGSALKDEVPEFQTCAGMVIGTPSYMSPEQALGLTCVDSKADVYSLGLLMYLMIAGRQAFTNGTDIEILKMQVQSKARPLREIGAAVPEEVEALVQVMLLKDPKLRPSMSQVKSRLDELLNQTEDEPTTLIDERRSASLCAIDGQCNEIAEARRKITKTPPGSPRPARHPAPWFFFPSRLSPTLVTARIRPRWRILGVATALVLVILSLVLGVMGGEPIHQFLTRSTG